MSLCKIKSSVELPTIELKDKPGDNLTAGDEADDKGLLGTLGGKGGG